MVIPGTFRAIDEEWTLTPVSGPGVDLLAGSVPVAAIVPGEAHLDLLRAGLIADPFDGANEAAQQWIGDSGWRYETRFEWPAGRPADEPGQRHDLVAYGLDTVADIELNGVLVGRTQNQHRSYRFDVRELLAEGENTLAVTFAAPVPETIERAGRYGQLPHVNHHAFNQLRKMACSFGWDWGIDVAGAGIWQPIGIDSWSGARIASVRPLTDVRDGAGVLTAHVEIERADAFSPAAVEVRVTVARVPGAGASGTAVVPPGSTTATVTMTVPRAELWWPAGHGEQPLYDVTVSAGDARWTGRVGFRTVHVNTVPDAAGNPFELRVNDELILVRGVNWIPDHAFLTQVDRDRYARRLRDAIEANVNLVRVWGGGIYESDDFYDLADAHGMLVWQDFPFACAAYAEEEHMAGEVEAEAREQIARLSPHPSLVIWNGCNENIWAWADWGWRDKIGDRTWGDGYYRHLLPALLAELDPTRFYSPASPYSFGDYLHPNDPRNGTTHIWDVWNRKDYTAYRGSRPRFVSEFGFQGPPAWSTLAGVVHDVPLDPYGPQMLVHQKANLGNEKLQRGKAGHLPPPEGTGPEAIGHWHWATQLNQAHAIRFGVEHFRSLTPHNTGMILWQLNDNWPVISWAAVDFDGHRKPLWHALRAAYAPRLATLQPRPSQAAIGSAFEGVPPVNDSIALVLVNDTAADFAGSFTVQRQDFHGKVLGSALIPARVPARGAATYELPASVSEFGEATAELIVARAQDAGHGHGDDGGFATAILDGADVARQRLDPQALSATATRADGGYEVTVTARSYARDVFLQADRVDPAATVDRGLVSLLAGEAATFHVTSRANADPGAFLQPWVLSSANGLCQPPAC